MPDIADYLSREIERRGLRRPEDVSSLIAYERNRYWQHLVSNEPDDGRRRNALHQFDQAGEQLIDSFRSFAPAGEPEAAPSKKKQIPRDLKMVLIGAAIAIPGTLLANYLSNVLFPQTTSVSVQTVGVQQLNAPRREFVFMSPTARSAREGTIDVVYGMGVDTTNYKCSVKVSEPRHFSVVKFDPACQQVSFKFIEPALFFEKASELNIGFNNSAVFSIEVISGDGKTWRGSQGIEYAVNDARLLK